MDEDRFDQRVVGLTGGLATGASTVARMLAECGALVVDADEIVHELEEPGTAVTQAIAERFGPEALDAEGRVDRSWLGPRVFDDSEALRDLGAIVHPEVIAESRRRIEALRAANPEALIVYNAPLLIEREAYKRFRAVVVVYVDDATQLERLMARDGLTRPQALKRLAAQMAPAAKRDYADVVIDNTGGLEATRVQVEACYGELMSQPLPSREA
ncbi:dephospho-CoA kinase [Nitrospinae bacterium AH_259_B05_G02_I21]|nr:dephospho-CoA kinase [Nitrospinae bacterium AH_259_B05_G02_I21]MDA2932035.1 dephospho-CoA kinase [Nitrospinae bacterium AH-259-F20]